MESHGPSLHNVYVLKPWRHRTRIVFPIPDVVLGAIGFEFANLNELLIVRPHAPWVSFRVFRPLRDFPLPDVRFEDFLPACPPRGNGGAT